MHAAIRIRTAKCCAAAVGALLYAAAAFGSDFSIVYHERLGAWSLRAVDGAKSSALRSQKPIDGSLLSFTAFAREFHVRLEPNERLLRELPQEKRLSLRGVEVWRGELVDIPGSWVRLTRSGRELSGVVFDGAELFAIDSAALLAPHLRSPEPSAYTGPIIYRWRDTTGTLTDELGALLDRAPMAVSSMTSAASVLNPPRQLDLGLVADAELSARDGAQTEARMLSRANIVDGIFMFQLGLHVNVGEISIFAQETDPFGEVVPSALLAELEEHRATTPAQSAQDLTHLLTGKNLAGPGPGVTIGIANIATVCDARFGVGLTQATIGIVSDALVMAHELGHNFGAPHDGESGPCVATPSTYLMAPSLRGSSEFSACSVQQMQPELASACLDLLAPGDVELRTVSAPVDAIVGESFTVRVAVDNPSAVGAHGVELVAVGTNAEVIDLRSQFSTFECTHASPLRCRATALASGESVELDVTARTSSMAPAALDVTVAALNDPNTANNAIRYPIGVRPTVDLVPVFGPAPELVRVGEQLAYSVTVRNAAAITATNAVARLLISPGDLNVLGLTSDGGACASDLAPWHTCSLGDLAPGTIRTLQLRLQARDNIAPAGFVGASIDVEVRADQPPIDISRTFASRSLVIAESVADLRTTVSPALQFQLNAPAEVVVTIDNLGPDPAADVVLEQRGGAFLNEGLTDVEMTSNLGGCTSPIPGTLLFSCSVSALPPGASLVVTIRGTASRSGPWALSSTARLRSWDPAPANNVVDAVYTVGTVAQPPPTGGGGTGGTGGTVQSTGGGGGGGAVDALWLLLLGIALAARRGICVTPRRSLKASVRPAPVVEAGCRRTCQGRT